MKNKENRIFSFFFPSGSSLQSYSPFIPLLRLRRYAVEESVGAFCAQLLKQFYTDQFETLQALLSWSVDVHVILALSSI